MADGCKHLIDSNYTSILEDLIVDELFTAKFVQEKIFTKANEDEVMVCLMCLYIITIYIMTLSSTRKYYIDKKFDSIKMLTLKLKNKVMLCIIRSSYRIIGYDEISFYHDTHCCFCCRLKG